MSEDKKHSGMLECDARVLAMAIDIDGCITIGDTGIGQLQPIVTFYNTCHELVEAVRFLAKDNNKKICENNGDRNGDRKNTLYYIRWKARDQVYNLLKEIEPYLIRKREQALLVIQLCRIRSQKIIDSYNNPYNIRDNITYGTTEQMLYEKVKELNSGGK
jgi:hypothetical protein